MTVTSLQLNDLSYLLKKEHIIATVGSERLVKDPGLTEHNYSVHAKTHIPLGDTNRYVDTISKWVSGQNKGAFIGGVTGDYGEGKTSFLVHTWEQAVDRDILAPPPFSWRSISDLIEGVHAWASYKLKQTHADKAWEAEKLWQEYRQKTLEEQAQTIATKTGQDSDAVLQILQQANASLEVSVTQFLDYCDALAEIVATAGYKGVLVLLDEPEVTAKSLSTSEVAQILFDMANGLISRDGNFGVFISIPENFMAQIRSSFSSLEPRLKARQCFVSLSSFYNNKFAETLWGRYAQELGFDSYKNKIISPLTLEALGQITSSGRRDLAYGPRTVITAFRRAVERYERDDSTYSPLELIEDTLDQEVSVRDTYELLIRQCRESPNAEPISSKAVTALCAFPEGIQAERLKPLGINTQELMTQVHPGHPLLYRRSGMVGLSPLQKQQGVTSQDVLQQHIQDIMDHYAPKHEVVEKAIEAFDKDILPFVFKDRQGQALVGWERERTATSNGVSFVNYTGAFEQTKNYPLRRVSVALSDVSGDVQPILNQLDLGEEPDVVVHLRFYWSSARPLPEWRADIKVGDAGENEPAIINLVLNVAEEGVEQEQLSRYLGNSGSLTPLAVLYLMNEMQKLSLPQQDEGIWKALRQMLLPKLVSALFGDELLMEQASKQLEAHVPGSAVDLIPTLTRYVLTERYPEYSTLMTQPGWQKKVQTYANVVSNQHIPLTARRSQEPWEAPKDEVARAFNMSLMNLSGGWATGMESLLTLTSGGSSIRIEFKLHPLEKHIQDEIMSSAIDRRIKIQGKECWWIPLDNIARFLLTSGYSQEELLEIVNIGKNRGTFSQELYKGKQPILYCLPFDPEQMRLKLREKADALKSQIEAFADVLGYSTDVNLVKNDADIAAVGDEAAFDRLQSEFNRQFEKENGRVPSYFGRLSDDIQRLERSAQQDRDDLKGARFSSLEASLTYKSSWGVDFERYIVSNLQHDTKALREEYDEMLSQMRLLKDKIQNKGGTITEQANRLTEGWASYNENQAMLLQAKTKNQSLDLHLRDFEKWLILLRFSDTLYGNLLDDRKNSSHQERADDFFAELTSLSGDVSNHLQTRGLSGLGSYKQFNVQFETLSGKRQAYQQGLRARFDTVKERINQTLNNLTVSARCTETFNPTDIGGCYGRLYAEGSGHIKEGLNREAQAVFETLRELRYAKDVLRSVEATAGEHLVEELSSFHRKIKETTNQISSEWIKRISNDGSVTQVQQEELKQLFYTSSKTTQQANQLLRRSPHEEPASDAKEMLELLDRPQDLKGLILELIGRGYDPEQVLESSLKSLSELFRQGFVNIKVEPPRR